MTIDSFMFCGEYDILEIRLNMLSWVDKFILTEATETFSGKPKELYWENRDKARFKQWEDKIIYNKVVSYDDTDIINQIVERGDYVNTPAHQKAFYQKETIRKVLETLKLDDEDIIYWGDVDEIPTKQEVDDKPHKLRQIAYSYYLNNRSSEDWRGTIVTKWKNLKNRCLNDLRAKPEEADILENGGYHFQNQGYDATIRKIQGSDHVEFDTDEVKDMLKGRMNLNMDFLGRTHDWRGNPFRFWVSEQEWPLYLKNTKQKWKHLLK